MSRGDIEDLVHRYADAVVHRDAEQWAATWAPNAAWDLGAGRRVEGLEAIVAAWREAMARYAVVVQTALNGTVELDDAAGTGSGRWYVQEAMRRTSGHTAIMLAHYDDAYVRIGGEWKFAARKLRPHYRGPPDLSGAFTAAGGA